MNGYKCFILILVFLITLSGCSLSSENNEILKGETLESETPEPTTNTLYGASVVTDEEIKKIQSEFSKMLLPYKDIYENAEKEPSPYRDSEDVVNQTVIDEIEDVLIRNGYPVINSDSVYPDYLENAGGVYTFWESVENKKDDETAFWGVSSSGGLFYRALQFSDEKAYCIVASTTWNEKGELELAYAQKREVLNWGMTYNSDFYYQDLPTDRHWDAATLLRLNPVNKTLYDLNTKCILPIGYHNVNIFLCDWNTADYGDLCFNDLFEQLYRMENNDFVYARDFEHEDSPYYHSCIPAKTFESTILPYFDIPLSDFREKTLYNAEKDIYPWQEISASNVMYFPSLIPEVTEAKENDDSSVTLTVNVMCLDKRTDCLFIHELTIMPLNNGKFKYLGNKIIYMGENELPSSQPRIPARRTTS